MAQQCGNPTHRSTPPTPPTPEHNHPEPCAPPASLSSPLRTQRHLPCPPHLRIRATEKTRHIRQGISGIVILPHSACPVFRLTAHPPQKIVISTEGGAPAAAAERPPHFARCTCRCCCIFPTDSFSSRRRSEVPFFPTHHTRVPHPSSAWVVSTNLLPHLHNRQLIPRQIRKMEPPPSRKRKDRQRNPPTRRRHPLRHPVEIIRLQHHQRSRRPMFPTPIQPAIHARAGERRILRPPILKAPPKQPFIESPFRRHILRRQLHIRNQSIRQTTTPAADALNLPRPRQQKNLSSPQTT